MQLERRKPRLWFLPRVLFIDLVDWWDRWRLSRVEPEVDCTACGPVRERDAMVKSMTPGADGICPVCHRWVDGGRRPHMAGCIAGRWTRGRV
nr:hypothetical protein [uncultured Holophaga sp.]